MSFASHLSGSKYYTFLDLIFLFFYESCDNSLINYLNISNITSSNILIMEEIDNLFPWIFLQICCSGELKAKICNSSTTTEFKGWSFLHLEIYN